MFNILVCDDDKEIVDAIDIYLSQEGYHILKAYDGLQAIEIMKKEEVHLILLDIMMPNLDGIRATRKIRETSSVPIIMLSAKSEDVDKILGLNIGADDYITKPFNPLELIARVKSQLRRYTQLGNLATEEKEAVYVCGGLVVNDDLKTVTVDGEPVKLTPIEYNILVLLIKNQGNLVFRIGKILRYFKFLFYIRFYHITSLHQTKLTNILQLKSCYCSLCAHQHAIVFFTEREFSDILSSPFLFWERRLRQCFVYGEKYGPIIT